MFQASLRNYQQALDKLSELEEDIRRLEQNIAVLQPQLDTTQAECEAIMADINTEKQQYMEANARCKGAESTINSESMNVKQLQDSVDKEFSKVSTLLVLSYSSWCITGSPSLQESLRSIVQC